MLPGPAGAARGERRRSPWHPGGPAWVRAANASAGRIGTASGEARVGMGGTRRPRKRGAVIAKRSRVLLVAVVLGGTDVAVCLGTGRVRVWLSFSFSCFWSVARLRFSSGRNKRGKKVGRNHKRRVGRLAVVCVVALFARLGSGLRTWSRVPGELPLPSCGAPLLTVLQLSSLCPFYFRAVAVFGHTAIIAHSQPILFLLH